MTKKIDIKYINVPNICFSLTDPDDDRENSYAVQRKERGFDNSELWSLYYTIAKFVYPRLKAFQEDTFGYPLNLTPKKWNNILKKMVKAFELIIDDKVVRSSKEQKEIDSGFKLFYKYFFHLWT